MRVSQVRSGPLDDAFLSVAVCHRRQTLPLIWARRRKPRIASNNLGTHTVNLSQPAGSANRFRRSAWAESIGVWARGRVGASACRRVGVRSQDVWDICALISAR
jgi:hypothetical protein